MVLCIREFFLRQFLVFAFRCLPAANVAFLLVFVKDGFHLVVQRLVYFPQLFRYVLMNGTLAYSELLRGRSDGRVIFYDIFSEYDTSFVFTCRRLFQMLSPLECDTVNIMLTNRLL